MKLQKKTRKKSKSAQYRGNIYKNMKISKK